MRKESKILRQHYRYSRKNRVRCNFSHGETVRQPPTEGSCSNSSHNAKHPQHSKQSQPVGKCKNQSPANNSRKKKLYFFNGGNSPSHRTFMVVGNGNQLDSSAVMYLVKPPGPETCFICPCGPGARLKLSSLPTVLSMVGSAILLMS